MADFHAYAKDMSPESQQEAERIAKQEEISKAMMAQSLGRTAPQPYMGRRRMIVPPAGPNAWAQIAQGLMSGFSDKVAADDKTALIAKDKQQVADALGAYNTQFQGTPENKPGDDIGPTMPAVAPDPMGAIRNALGSQQPILRHLADKDFAAETARVQHDRDLKQKAQDKQDSMDLARALKVSKEIPKDWEKHLPEGAKRGPTPGTYIAADGDTMQMTFEDGALVNSHNVNPQPKGTQDRGSPGSNKGEVVDPDPKFPGRVLLVDLGKYKPGTTLGAAGVYGVSKNEGVQGGREAKRIFNMGGIGATLTSARDILNGKGGEPLPTGSGFGTALDYVSSLANITPDGASQADQMKVLGGALTAKMPRMEGPQSDKDTAMYREMAGRIGDSGISAERRLKALDEVEKLWAKYEHLNPGTFADSKGSPAGAGAPSGWTPEKAQRLKELQDKARGAN